MSLQGPLAIVPLLNIVLLARDLLAGTASAAAAGVVVIATLVYIGTSAQNPSMLNSQGVHYGSDLNANGTPDGREYDRSGSTTPGKAWRSTAPNGAVNIADALVALLQIGTNCN